MIKSKAAWLVTSGTGGQFSPEEKCLQWLTTEVVTGEQKYPTVHTIEALVQFCIFLAVSNESQAWWRHEKVQSDGQYHGDTHLQIQSTWGLPNSALQQTCMCSYTSWFCTPPIKWTTKTTVLPLSLSAMQFHMTDDSRDKHGCCVIWLTVQVGLELMNGFHKQRCQ